MTLTVNELQQLKGVGRILAERLLESGLDSFKKIAAGEALLRGIKGINPKAVQAITEQAAALASARKEDKAARIEALKSETAGLRAMLNSVASGFRDRFPNQLAEKYGEKLTRDIVRALDTLELVEGKLGKRVKRAAAGLTKARQRMEKTSSSDPAAVRKGLKKTRKALKRILA